ncbi:MAG: amino acid ABC transporter substrate-binding protein [Acidimicrobiia bacterium]|nr:amino acid ABC transporter substrate-binding protein [Acidimicrobiia bacterium]
MKKRFMVMLSILALVLAACGTEAEETTTTAAPDGSTETTAPPSDGDGDGGAQTGGSLLDTVLARGELNCGVNETLPGFGSVDSDGNFVGFDVDLCRAVAAALFGDADAVRYEALTAAARFEAVNSGLIDLLSRNTTWTQSRDTELGLDFGPTTYYDGQQVMGRAADGFSSASALSEIDGAVVCTNAGTTTELNISEAAAALGISITLNTFEDFNIVMENFKSGACDVVTTDGSGLVSRKAADPEGGDWVIFPSVPISKEPLGPAWAQNNSRFGDVVTWTIFAMQIAEEQGVTQANVDEMVANPPNGEIARLLGGEGELQSVMGLPADAFYQVISQVGNYADVFDRHLRPLGLERGLNALYSDGGLQYPPPAR